MDKGIENFTMLYSDSELRVYICIFDHVFCSLAIGSYGDYEKIDIQNLIVKHLLVKLTS